MNGCTTKLDGDFWIENAYSGLERFKGVILVRKDTKYAGFDTKANACRNVFLCGLEPGVALGLHGRRGQKRFGGWQGCRGKRGRRCMGVLHPSPVDTRAAGRRARHGDTLAATSLCGKGGTNGDDV